MHYGCNGHMHYECMQAQVRVNTVSMNWELHNAHSCIGMMCMNATQIGQIGRSGLRERVRERESYMENRPCSLTIYLQYILSLSPSLSHSLSFSAYDSVSFNSPYCSLSLSHDEQGHGSQAHLTAPQHLCWGESR